MKKLLILLLLSLGLIGCSESVPEQVKFETESYDWKKWDCYDYGYGGEYLLTIGYIPELTEDGFSVGKLFLKGSESPIDTIYSLNGVQHYWNWFGSSSLVEQSYQIVIDSDGTGRFWDFTGAEEGESRDSKETYKCTSSDLEEFNRVMNAIF